jgi:hypothetical protein
MDDGVTLVRSLYNETHPPSGSLQTRSSRISSKARCRVSQTSANHRAHTQGDRLRDGSRHPRVFLNKSVGLHPRCLRGNAGKPQNYAGRGASYTGVFPSASITIGTPSSNGDKSRSRHTQQRSRASCDADRASHFFGSAPLLPAMQGGTPFERSIEAGAGVNTLTNPVKGSASRLHAALDGFFTCFMSSPQLRSGVT